jgi:DNA-binding NarL/FixJ family response regulator
VRVLIVDDQPSFRDAARALLHARGHHVVAEADCGRDALEALARFGPDAVLVDVGLGGESGLDVSRALVSAKPGLTVLLMSADHRAITPERLRESGARGFLPKRSLVHADLATLLQLA